SSTTGDTKSDDLSWSASLFATAVNILPEDPNAKLWEEKGRQYAYNAITTPSDLPDSTGLKVTTVPENFALANHGNFPNPYYEGATIHMLGVGALFYKLFGNPVPAEFDHHVSDLYAEYRSHVREDLMWDVVCDPIGDATIFPFGNVNDFPFEAAVMAAKTGQNVLWKSTTVPVAVLVLGPPAWEAVMDAKIVSIIMLGSYGWHFPPALCIEFFV
ncbi:MAG: hypothetical protein Q7S28_01380, partial [bacterium]|nr:hypothetical protein [bacterium]